MSECKMSGEKGDGAFRQEGQGRQERQGRQGAQAGQGKQRGRQREWNGQLAMATLLTMAGVGLLFMGFWCAPEGEIHHSVLVGFGEVSTFAGALFGVDYTYKYKYGQKEE